MAIRVGVIGTGPAARAHIRVMARVPQAKIVAVASKHPDKSAALSAEFGMPWQSWTPEALIDSEEIDAVVIAVPPIYQPPLAVRAFRRGKHVLCEKPLAVSVSQARSIVKAWRAAKRVGMINFGFRLIPQIQTFKTLLAKGKCGVLHHIEAHWLLPNRLDRSRSFYWKGQKEEGGGALQSHGVHMLDYLFHDQKGVRICGARQSVFFKTRPDAKGRARRSTGDEETSVLLETGTGVPVTLHVSLVTKPGEGQRVVARGSEGMLEVRNLNPNNLNGPFSLWHYPEDARKGVCLSAGDDGPDYSLETLFMPIDQTFIRAAASHNLAAHPSLADGLKTVELTAQIQDVGKNGL